MRLQRPGFDRYIKTDHMFTNVPLLAIRGCHQFCHCYFFYLLEPFQNVHLALADPVVNDKLHIKVVDSNWLILTPKV